MQISVIVWIICTRALCKQENIIQSQLILICTVDALKAGFTQGVREGWGVHPPSFGQMGCKEVIFMTKQVLVMICHTVSEYHV